MIFDSFASDIEKVSRMHLCGGRKTPVEKIKSMGMKIKLFLHKHISKLVISKERLSEILFCTL